MVSVVVLWVGSRGRPTRNVIDRSVEWSSNFSISTFPITIWSILFKELLTSLVVVGANNRNAMNYALLRSCCCLLFAFSMTMTTMANTMCGLKKRPFFSLYMITFTQWSRRAYSTPLRLKKNNNGKDWNKFLTPSFSSASPPSDLQHGQRVEEKERSSGSKNCSVTLLVETPQDNSSCYR